jgi:cobalt/nickel transport system permease protein
LTEEGERTVRARELRSYKKRGMEIKPFISILNSLLLRTWLRAERIHMAMLARGFSGSFSNRYQHKFGKKESLFLILWVLVFLFLRFNNVSNFVGKMFTGIFL